MHPRAESNPEPAFPAWTRVDIPPRSR